MVKGHAILFIGGTLQVLVNYTQRLFVIPEVDKSIPHLLMLAISLSGYFMIIMAIVITVSASYESRSLLTLYNILSVFLMMYLMGLSVQLNFFSLILKEDLSRECMTKVMPAFKDDFFT